MIIGSCIFTFTLEGIHSIKERRKFINSVKERLKQNNCSLCDLSGEFIQEADIAVVFVSPNALIAAKTKESIVRLLQNHYPEVAFELNYEEI